MFRGLELAPRFGPRMPLLAFALLSLATLVGFGMLEFGAGMQLSEPQVHLREYLVAGGLIHFGVISKPAHRQNNPIS